MDELKYSEQLYCLECGEDKELKFEGNYAGTHHYKCKACNGSITISEITE